MTAAEYKAARQLRGTQSEVAAQLGVRQATISDRENGGEITREAWLALNALPKKRKAKKEPAGGVKRG
jgi:DNA-binding XRE family transcriptional regulator